MLLTSTACHTWPRARSASSPSFDDFESRFGIKICALRPIAIANNHRKALPPVIDHKHQLALERYMARAVSLRCSLAANSNHSSGVKSSVDPHWRSIERAENLTPERLSGGTDAFTPHFKLTGPIRASNGGELDGRNGEGAKCSRRETVAASLAACLLFSISSQPEALAGGFDKYLKKKKLDPLDTYVPTVILAQSQFQEVGEIHCSQKMTRVVELDSKLGGEQKTYADARSLLRTGPAASLRTDIRAVAQYAAETGNDDGVSAVDQCLSALEDLDSLLLRASREQGAPVERMRKDLTATVAALDRLLATVPAPILEKAKSIADAYKDY